MAVNGQWHKTNDAYVFHFLLTAPRHGCVCVCAEKLSFDTCQNALSCLRVCVCLFLTAFPFVTERAQNVKAKVKAKAKKKRNESFFVSSPLPVVKLFSLLRWRRCR